MAHCLKNKRATADSYTYLWLPSVANKSNTYVDSPTAVQLLYSKTFILCCYRVLTMNRILALRIAPDNNYSVISLSYKLHKRKGYRCFCIKQGTICYTLMCFLRFFVTRYKSVNILLGYKFELVLYE